MESFLTWEEAPPLSKRNDDDAVNVETFATSFTAIGCWANKLLMKNVSTKIIRPFAIRTKQFAHELFKKKGPRLTLHGKFEYSQIGLLEYWSIKDCKHCAIKALRKLGF